jgi:predicted dehydrogenase
MSEYLNWGVLGGAKFAKDHMVPAMQLARRTRFGALATSSAEKAALFREIEPTVEIHNSYEALLEDPKIDAVYIPLPNNLHLDWTIKAIKSGKPVLCEKPLCLRAEDFDQLIAVRDEAGRLVAEAFMIVHHPQWQMAKQLFEAGAIGTIKRVSCAFSYDNSRDPGNIRNSAQMGGGALPDIGVYTMGSVRFVTGEEPVEILSSYIDWENDVDVWSHCTARFPSFHYTGVVSMRMSPWQDVTFHGTDGVMRLTAPFNPGSYGEAQIELHRPTAPMAVETLRFPAANHYVNQLEAFAATVLDGAEYPCSLEFVQGTQKMMDAVIAKAKG